ncbi:MAG: hypothetical protein CME06_13255 [Gemmatimonadetes bacterium]|nr:hypothetical protein [Gemmatimonadota bacterium]
MSRSILGATTAAAALAANCCAAVHTVPTDFPAIQGAIDVSVDGDTVLVLPGTYAEHEIAFDGRAILVTGSAPDDPAVVASTVVDGRERGTVFLFHSFEDTTSVLDGLTVTGGLGEIGTESRGGGITCRPDTGPTIRRCFIRDNRSLGHGGGISCFLAAPTIEKCRIERNSAEEDGGGILCDWSSASIRNCGIRDNRAWSGGGVGTFWESNAELIGCVVESNVADYRGGGVSATQWSSLTLERCRIRGNRAERGGGIGGDPSASTAALMECEISGNSAWRGGGLYGVSGSAVRCRLADNTAEDDGGGYYGSGSQTMSHCSIERNTAGGSGGGIYQGGQEIRLDYSLFTENSGTRGGAIHCEAVADAFVDHCTVVANFGTYNGAAFYRVYNYGYSRTEITSSIVWGNGSEAIAGEREEVFASYSDIHGGWPGEGNIDSYPLFCESGCGEIGSLTLAPASPCLGSGESGSDMGARGLGCDARIGMHTIRVPEDVGTIEEALSADLCDGDTVLVAPGTYTESGLQLSDREVVLTGTAPFDPTVIAATVIDARGEGPVIEAEDTGGRHPRVEGLTITGGAGEEGGGIACRPNASPRIVRCAIVGNRSSGSGGGIGGSGGTPIISRTLFDRNHASLDGGGLWLHSDEIDLRLEDCVFLRNSADRNGGGASGYRLEVEACRFIGNRAGKDGGGYRDASISTIRDCEFLGNRARTGGGLRTGIAEIDRCIITASRASLDAGGIYGSGCTIRHCIVRNNVATLGGGGVYLDGGEIARTLLIGNSADSGGGLRSAVNTTEVDGVTITGNRAEVGAGISVPPGGGYARVINSIVWGNEGPEIGPEPFYSVKVSYSLVEGGWQGDGNIDGDPVFLSYGGLDYLLGPGSPAIDAGDPEVEDEIYDRHPWWPPNVPNGVRGDMGAYGGPDNDEWLLIAADDAGEVR